MLAQISVSSHCPGIYVKTKLIRGCLVSNKIKNSSDFLKASHDLWIPRHSYTYVWLSQPINPSRSSQATLLAHSKFVPTDWKSNTLISFHPNQYEQNSPLWIHQHSQFPETNPVTYLLCLNSGCHCCIVGLAIGLKDRYRPLLLGYQKNRFGIEYYH